MRAAPIPFHIRGKFCSELLGIEADLDFGCTLPTPTHPALIVLNYILFSRFYAKGYTSAPYDKWRNLLLRLFVWLPCNPGFFFIFYDPIGFGITAHQPGHRLWGIRNTIQVRFGFRPTQTRPAPVANLPSLATLSWIVIGWVRLNLLRRMCDLFRPNLNLIRILHNVPF